MIQGKKPPSQRQLRVGEELRHAISSVMLRNEVHEPLLEKVSVTVSEVRISPDLKNATVYVTPLAGVGNAAAIIERLNAVSPAIRRAMNEHVVLKYSPKLFFKQDRSFDEANRINQLLHNPDVRKDITKPVDEESDQAEAN